PCPPSRMPHLRQRLRGARVFLLERVEDFIGAAAQQREAAELELARTRRKRRGAERIAVRLQRVRGAPERLGVPGVGGMPKLGKHLRRPVENRPPEFDDEIVARVLLELGEDRAIDRWLGHRFVLGGTFPSARTSWSTRMGFVT